MKPSRSLRSLQRTLGALGAALRVPRPPRSWLWTLLGLPLTLLAVTLALVATALHALAPQPGEWTLALRLGPFTRPLSVPALIRIATHPVGLALLDGRSTTTPLGRWAWRRGPGDRLVGVCAPCTLQLAALGPAPLTMPRAALELQRDAQSRFRGTLDLGQGERTLALRWRATLTASALVIDAQLPTVPLADAYAAFGSASIPELASARIGGTLSASLRLALPERRLDLRPRIDGFEVDGLGTEQLLHAAPPSRCAASSGLGRQASEARVTGWLPRAVVAAEDQRFQEHTGYDLVQLLAAAQLNHDAASAAQGASTLTQQLAKWLYTGDERSVARKLRELLYAVEMERTLGKGRILQLYLAMAPWGEGVCGAEAAARHYLRKPAALLSPLEAAWLASLLQGSVDGERHVDVQRVSWVLASLRGPLSAERRAEQLAALRDWTPPAARTAREGSRR